MGKVKNKCRLVRIILLVMILICHSPVMAVNAEFKQEKEGWKKEGEDWYCFDKNGLMKNGWIWAAGYWYFLNPDNNGGYGRMMTGWQWIDGRCYYFADHSGTEYPKGAMYINGRTPDGYLAGASGAWVDESGIVQISGKGIQTSASSPAISAGKRISRGSSGGGGSGGRGGSAKPDNKTENPDSNLPEPGESAGETEEKEVKTESYSFTVRYVDIRDKTILQVVTGIGAEGETIVIMQPDIDGYKLCKGQKKSFDLSNGNIIINIYYEIESPASPSEARKVEWNLYFVEEGNHNNEIFKSQQGKTEEGSELVVDFPETILGADRYYYHSLVSSPWSMIVNGNGIQKYYIEYQKGESLPEEADPDREAKDRMRDWLEVARKSDLKLTGEEPSNQQLITKNIQDSNNRLLNLVSMVDSIDRQEVYLIAEGHVPSTVIISQTFRDVKNISELVRDEFTINGEQYTVMRVGFERTFDEETCNHDYEVVDRADSTCTENGHITVRCRKCGKEETVLLPATGHTDADHDGNCDICYEPADQEPEAIHYSVGNVQARTIGNKIYLFRCIDDDYEDAMGNSQQMALFLCDSVIRSDISGVANKINFGDNNNYKYSKVREWLLDHANSDFIHETYIGVTQSYIGATRKGAYEQFDDNSIMGVKDMFQLLQDKVFVLSVDEALKYREYLWKFNGSETNNPEYQMSAYSKGYYLRTPQDGGLDDFWYGDGIYGVSLADGNIQPVNVSETSMGIRPAMAIPQG